MKKKFTIGLASLALSGMFALPVLAQDKGELFMGRPQVQKAKHDVSRPLRDIAPLEVRKGDGHGGEPREYLLPGVGKGGNDGAVQETMNAPAPLVAITSGLNFDGVGQAFSGPQGNFTVNSAPPDTTGAAGATQYVQWVNTSFAVFNKSTGSVVYGPAAGRTLWNGFGGVCETENDGDPIVQYDKAAGRWVMSQFAVPGGAAGYWQCVAVSQTSDATGAYNRYAFQYNQFPDYPKMGVWPDAYYVTYNMFTSTFQGARVCAMDRSRMLAGLSATQQCFQLSTSFGSLQPADLDGSTAPPAGSPNYMLNFGTNSLRLWKFSVNWTTPASTTLTGPTSIPVASFTSYGGSNVTQPDTNQKLDTLGDRLMFRLAYRNFGTHEALTVSHTVRAGTNRQSYRGAVRWYELRNPNGAVSVHQQGTYSPDTTHRWMSSIAQDKDGNMAIGFNASSKANNVKPGVRFVARAAADPLNTVGNETIIQNATGVQTTGLSRWGDYSHLSIDPADDCTFWYTTEYIANNGTFNWRTRIGSFKLGTCN
jgi:hypothetical protein